MAISLRIIFISFLLYFFNCNNLIAQNLQWAKQFGGTQSDAAYSNIIDQAGNIYVTGSTDVGSPDFFICKYDTSGTLLWTKTMGGPGTDFVDFITVDDSCNIYITGAFSDSLDFDPGIGIAYLKSKGYIDAFILKLDSSGNFIWVNQAGGSQLVENRGRSCAISDNYLFWTGTFSDTLYFPVSGILTPIGFSLGLNDIFIIKLDRAGNFLWIKIIGGSGADIVTSISLGNIGNLFVTGGFNGLCDFDPDTTNNFDLTSYGNSDIFICELDTEGNFIWAKQFGGSNFDVGTDVTSDNLGNIYCIGYFNDTLDADPNAGVLDLISHGLSDVCLIKLDIGGNLIWAKNWGGIGYDFGFSLCLDSGKNVYTTGKFTDTVDFDPGSGIFNLVCNNGGDCFVSKINNAGSLLWANQLHGTNDNIGYSIKLDIDENIYVVGGVAGVCDFDPSNNLYNITSAGIYDGYIFKWSQPLTALQHVSKKTELLQVYPNPFAEIIHLNLAGKSTVTIRSIAGQIILKTVLPAGTNMINLATQQSGTYLLNVLTDKSSNNAIVVKSD